MSTEPRRLRVMLAFAGTDRPLAIELRDALVTRGIEVFIDEHTESGQDIIQTISDAIAQFDYFVLLWSAHTVGNRYVQAEYTAAFMRGLTERRPFVHVVRLDDTPPPRLLAPIRYLDFRGGWDEVADRLVAAWRRDRPAPDPAPDAVPTIDVCVCNEELSVARRITVPASATVQDLLAEVRARLALKEKVAAFDGQVGARFFYRLEKDERQFAVNESLATAGITNESSVNLRVRVEWFGPGGLSADLSFRNGDPSHLSEETQHQLIDLAFGHLSARLAGQGQSGNGSQPNP